MKAMDVIPYEENSFYIFDRGHNDFKRLHDIESIGGILRHKRKEQQRLQSNEMEAQIPF